MYILYSKPYWIDCIALRPSRYILRYMTWRASLSYGMVESGYNPNLSITEISQIYSNIPRSHSGSTADGETGEEAEDRNQRTDTPADITSV